MTPAAVLSILIKTQGVAAATGELSKLESTAQKASKSTDAMAAKSKAGFATISNASKYVAFGVAGIGAAAIKSAGDFQSSMNQLQAVSGVSTRELGKLRKEAIKLGADVKLPATSAQDAAEAMTEMVKAGVSVKDTMGGVRDVLVLSAAAQVSNAKAAEIASNAMNAFHLKGKDVKQITDELANTANASSVEITDVADSFQMAAAVFSGFQGPAVGAKKAMTELNVAIGILGNAGIKGSDAGTSLKQTLLQLTGPSNKAKDAMKALYIAAKDNSASETGVAAALRGTATERGKALAGLIKHNKALGGSADIAYDATGKMRSLKDVIALVSAGTKNMTQEEKNSALTQIFGADATRSIIALMSAGPAAFDKMTASVTKQGAAQELANSKMKGFKGSVEAFKSTLETLAIAFGTTLLPAVTSIVKQLTGFVNVLGAHQKAASIAIGVLGGLATAVIAVNLAVKAWRATTVAMVAVQAVLNAVLIANPIGIVVIALAALAVGVIYAYKHSKTFRDNVDELWASLKVGIGVITAVSSAVIGALGKALSWAKDHWPSIRAILIGPFGLAVLAIVKHFEQIKTAAGKLPGQIANAIKSAPGVLANAGISVGKGITDGVITGLGQLGHMILQKFKDAAGFVKDKIGGLFSGIGKIVGKGSGDGIGKGLAGGVLPSGGAFGGSLKGASSSLRPFAAIGSRFGLSVSSGRRPGAITTSGNVSYHSTGEAIDEAGTPAGMMGYFKYLKSHFGGRLAELIYGPGRVGIKDGRPFNFGSALNAQHMDHVHVAFDTGRPGVGDGIGRPGLLRRMGDGIGRFTATSYGPPWNAMNGTGVTATGVNLKGGPHRYGIAVDPRVIPLGSKLKITPNPFGYSGAFTAFDTGGAIKGNHIDFYDWRGRNAQLGWGSRTVTISTVGKATKKAAKNAVAKFVSRPGSSSFAAQAHAAAVRNAQRQASARTGPAKGLTPKQVAQTADQFADTGEDPNQPLIDAQNAAKDAADALAAQLAAVRDEMKRGHDIAEGIQATDAFQTKKAFADVLSGFLVGYGVTGRSFTPGTGTEYAY